MDLVDWGEIGEADEVELGAITIWREKQQSTVLNLCYPVKSLHFAVVLTGSSQEGRVKAQRW